MLRPATRTASIVLTSLLIAACSGSGSGTTAPSASSAPSAAASSAAPSGSAAAGGDEYEIKTGTAAAITGKFLTGEDGKTLYIFKKDTQGSGKSTCSGDCAAKWPAFTVDDGEQATAGDGVTATKITMITRDDGSKQVAYDGWPLYYFASDSAAGDVNGQGVGNVWFVATP
jgi:predicted lipoprotein with Yx(FWY)xxD motif